MNAILIRKTTSTIWIHTSATDRCSTLTPSLRNHADIPTAVKLLPYLPQHIPERLVNNVCVALLKLTEGCSHRNIVQASFTNLNVSDLSNKVPLNVSLTSSSFQLHSDRHKPLYGNLVVRHLVEPSCYHNCMPVAVASRDSIPSQRRVKTCIEMWYGKYGKN
jgi:hypothetical protein